MEAFAYSVSHDLRAPLRAMEGFSVALLNQYSDKLDEQGQHYLNRIQVASERMGQLISDLLDLSRINRKELTPQQVNLSALALEIADELKMLDLQRQVEFIISDAIIAQGDAGLLRIVLQNLLANAWKFTSSRQKTIIEFGEITTAEFLKKNTNSETFSRDGLTDFFASQESNPQSKVYYVRDNGVGFNMEFSSKLFSPFQRLHAMHEFPGTGIGLAITQRVISRHRGFIWPEAQEGKGAIFYFTLGGRK